MSNQLFVISLGVTLAIVVSMADFVTIGLLGAEWLDKAFAFGTGMFLAVVLEEAWRRAKKFEEGE